MDRRTRSGFLSWKVRQSAILRNKFQRGQATLEILIVLLILIPLIFGGIELSRGVALKAALDSGVGVAVRTLSIDPTQWGWSANVVATTVAHNVFGCSGCIVHLAAYNSSGDKIDEGISSLTYGEPFYLEGWVIFTPDIPLITLTPITIRVRHYGVIERINEGT